MKKLLFNAACLAVLAGVTLAEIAMANNDVAPAPSHEKIFQQGIARDTIPVDRPWKKDDTMPKNQVADTTFPQIPGDTLPPSMDIPADSVADQEMIEQRMVPSTTDSDTSRVKKY